MSEGRQRLFATWLQALGMLGAIAGAALALWQYRDTSQKQFEAPIWQKQVDLYTSATETIACLAYTKDPKEWENARLRFWELYGGSLILVEDDEVANGMIDFGTTIDKIGSNLKTRDENFVRSAIKLSYKFRKSIENSVGSNLPALGVKKPPGNTSAH